MRRKKKLNQVDIDLNEFYEGLQSALSQTLNTPASPILRVVRTEDSYPVDDVVPRSMFLCLAMQRALDHNMLWLKANPKRKTVPREVYQQAQARIIEILTPEFRRFLVENKLEEELTTLHFTRKK